MFGWLWLKHPTWTSKIPFLDIQNAEINQNFPCCAQELLINRSENRLGAVALEFSVFAHVSVSFFVGGCFWHARMKVATWFRVGISVLMIVCCETFTLIAWTYARLHVVSIYVASIDCALFRCTFLSCLEISTFYVVCLRYLNHCRTYSWVVVVRRIAFSFHLITGLSLGT